MKKNANLPPLPGYSFDRPIGKEYFGRRQYCLTNGDICIVDRDPLKTYKPSVYLKGMSSDVPPWVLFDKQTLTFDAVFKNDPNSAPRFVKVMYFLEDGTMKVVEPKTVNSGLNQGTIVGRQRIPIGDDYVNYYEATDLNVGKEIDIYKKRFLLVDCNKFTRTFLTKIGIIVPETVDLHMQNKAVMNGVQTGRHSLSAKPVHSSVQFLEYDRKILRFFGYWEENGDIHHLELLFYLADDSVEIYEILPTGKKHVFLQKGPLPKDLQTCLVANFKSPTEVYSPADLSVGSKINVYGRMICLTSCDPFTKEYYKVKYGIENFEETPMPESKNTTPLLPNGVQNQYNHRKELPPWNGIGSFDDSAGNCNSLLPKSHRCDFDKFLTKDSIGNDSHILRFMARLLTEVSDDAMRKFVISYYLRDDTISVFEMKLRNTGFQGGMIFKRNVIVVPGQNLYVNQKPLSYTYHDMWIGNKLVINDHNFLLVNSDEYTLKYMEQHPEEFEKSNICLIIDKIKHKLLSVENSYKEFVAKNMNSTVAPDNNVMPILLFESALKEIAGDILTEHEFITVIRHFRDQKPAKIHDRERIRSIVYSCLVRNLWDGSDRLLEHFQYLDNDSSGYLPKKDVRFALMANRLPISDDVMTEMLNIILKNEKDELYYSDVIDFLNFNLKPAQSMIAMPSKSTKKEQSFRPDHLIPERSAEDIYIRWSSFIQALNLDYLLTSNP